MLKNWYVDRWCVSTFFTLLLLSFTSPFLMHHRKKKKEKSDQFLNTFIKKNCKKKSQKNKSNDYFHIYIACSPVDFLLHFCSEFKRFEKLIIELLSLRSTVTCLLCFSQNQEDSDIQTRASARKVSFRLNFLKLEWCSLWYLVWSIFCRCVCWRCYLHRFCYIVIKYQCSIIFRVDMMMVTHCFATFVANV